MATSFSVIIPTYMEERAIGRTLRNLRRAGLGHNMETIVVDSDSPDRTGEIASGLGARVINIRRRGISVARNHGAGLARGDILAFIDADSIIPANLFPRLEAVFSEPGVVGASCRMMPDPTVKPTLFEYSFYRVWSGVKSLAHMIKPCTSGENGIFVRRETFKRLGGFDETLPVIEDLDFVFRASRRGSFLLLRDLTIKDSIRRFRELGVLAFSKTYLTNWIYYTFMKSSRVSEWHPVR
jgi:glycosyltransferase involved in cell wall biosynthesis